jgi:hypothetical protein
MGARLSSSPGSVDDDELEDAVVAV